MELIMRPRITFGLLILLLPALEMLTLQICATVPSFGGAGGRSRGFMCASQALCQLSYIPGTSSTHVKTLWSWEWEQTPVTGLAGDFMAQHKLL